MVEFNKRIYDLFEDNILEIELAHNGYSNIIWYKMSNIFNNLQKRSLENQKGISCNRKMRSWSGDV